MTPLTASSHLAARFYCLPASAHGDGVFLSKAEHLDPLSLVTSWFSSTSKHSVTAVITGEQRT